MGGVGVGGSEGTLSSSHGWQNWSEKSSGLNSMGVEVGFGSDGGMMGSCGGGFGSGLHLAMGLALSGGVAIGPGAFAVPSLVIGDIGVEQLVPSHSNLYFNCACVLHWCTH